MGLEINKVKYCKNWPLVRLKEICNRISDGTHFTPEYIPAGIPFISVKDIYEDKVHFDKCKYISVQAHKELIKRCHPEKDDILITKSGTIGRMALVPAKPEFSLFVSVALIKNKKELINSKFLKLCLENFLNSINISQDIKGGLLKNFHLEDIRETLVPTVALQEQQRIVSKIEELFSELDKGIENLRIAKQQLKAYRQSVLKWAFDGKLTEEWRCLNKKMDFHFEIETLFKKREDNFNSKLANAKKDREPKPRTPKSLDKKFKIYQDYLRFVGDIPKEWLIVHLAAISNDTPDSIVDGPFGSSINVDEDYVENGVPVIRINNILQFAFEKSKLKFIRKEKFAELKRHNILPGDVLFGKVGTIGNSCIYPVGEPEGMLSTTGSCRIRIDERIITNKYLCYYLNSRKNNFNEIASAAVQAFLNMETINNFPIPICPIEEQQNIVQAIESRLSVADKMEESLTQSLQQAEALRQSILKKAFEGKLLNETLFNA